MRARSSLFTTVAALLASAPAGAQTFPAESAWVPFQCRNNTPMSDGVGDQAPSLGDRDIVGTTQAPAAHRAVDDNFLYLRLRLDTDPSEGTELRRSAWGFAFSTDGRADGYELLVTADGFTRTVNLWRNSTITVPDSPLDPADTPAVVMSPFSTHGRAVTAPSNLGGNGDFFLEMAVAWRDLEPLGVTRDTNLVVWAGSSSAADRLDGDLACTGGAGAGRSGPLSDSGSASSRAAPPPGTGGSGGAGGSPPPGGVVLEGGPGCAVGGSASPAPLWLVTALTLGLARRRRR